MDHRIERHEIQGTLISDVAVMEPNSAPSECILLLHGYLQSGNSILKRLGPALPASARVISPNGPYPLPRRQEDRWRLGFTWYFYDASTDSYFIDMKVALELVSGLCARFDAPSVPWRIIGYSQGGYLAPFAALRIPRVKQVIGVSCRFLEDELPARLPFRLDAIHGELDETVDLADAKASHLNLISGGRALGGEFRVLPAIGHGIGEPMREALRELLGAGSDPQS